jgi:TPR repeat protein
MFRVGLRDGALGFWLRIGVSVSAAAVMLYASVAWAGPEEQYSEGWRAYQAGDVGGAMRLLEAPADAGHAPSQVLLADVLEKAGFFDQSVAYYRKAADAGDAQGRYGLALAYAAGKGAPRDLQQARRLITLAAEQGHGAAVNALAQAWISGGLGIPKDETPGSEGIGWIRKAADSDYLPAVDYLASAYRSGNPMPADIKLAERYEAKADQLRYPNGKPRVRRRN